MGFSRHEYWSELPFPSPGDLPDPRIKPTSHALESRSERERRILALLGEMHTEIIEGEGKTLEEIADYVGVHPRVIHRDEKNALKKLRKNRQGLEALRELWAFWS